MMTFSVSVVSPRDSALKVEVPSAPAKDSGVYGYIHTELLDFFICHATRGKVDTLLLEFRRWLKVMDVHSRDELSRLFGKCSLRLCVNKA